MSDRRCNKCNEVKPLSEYYNVSKTKNRKDTICKKCVRQRNQAYYFKHRDTALPLHREKGRQKTWTMKLEMIQAYGGVCSCPGCNETEPMFMTVDHVYNDGKEERKLGLVGTGHNFYRRLKKLGWPKDRYQLLCFNCNMAKAHWGECPHVHKA